MIDRCRKLYTILETKGVREIGRGHFASVLIAYWRRICPERNILQTLRPRRKEISQESQNNK